jgi:DNA-binding CsgD family transcriptional regulator
MKKSFKNQLIKSKSTNIAPEKWINQYNYLAIQILEHIGITEPTQQQVDLIENIVSGCGIQVRAHFDNCLSKKEIACLYWAAHGKSSQKTAELLAMSQSTVEAHRKEIKRKLKCSTIGQAIFEGLRYGWIAVNSDCLKIKSL